MTIGQRIRNRRIAKGYSVEQLAEIIGKNKATVYRYENTDIGKLPADILEPLAKALDTTPAHLMGWDEKEKHTTHTPKAVRINVYGTIPAGVPIEAIKDIDDWEEIPFEMTAGGKEFIALKVKGDSMWPEYLEDDVVIIQLQPDCENGEDCAVYVNGYDVTLKKVKKSEGKITLTPLNTNYPPKTYTHPGEIKILGKVVELRRKK